MIMSLNGDRAAVSWKGQEMEGWIIFEAEAQVAGRAVPNVIFSHSTLLLVCK